MDNVTDIAGNLAFTPDDRRNMRRAMALARQGQGLASPNPTVGCVIVQAGRRVGEGLHDYSLKDHAEVRALREAGGRAKGGMVYTTLEPCSHYGRTPPCADQLIEAGVRRVVVATTDPNPKVSGSGIEKLRAAGVRVEVGLLHDEAQVLIEPFACLITRGLPLVVAKAGMTLDGRIATRTGEDRWITSPEGREFGQSLRLQLDAILVGSGAILADDPELTYRGSLPKARLLTRVLLDSKLRTPPNARVLKSVPQGPVLIFCGCDAPVRRRRKLEERGAEILAVTGGRGGLDLRAVLWELAARNVLGVLVEGGGEVHWSFLSAGLVDKFFFIMAPLVLGGRSVPVVGGRGYKTIKEALRFIVRRSFTVGSDLVIEAYPFASHSILSPWLSSTTLPSGARGWTHSSVPK
ncbi:MAG TPA: bifunctional diaminohydroxyphosphoribosylaminopyrimidine deaminase/5-amino-6-(5-phosphoribosylamino)uracil reductase RibD [Acidobacteriota bacterium]|nr:bifunctional diaminohydroxyphosphoribosylaminopyrimidine deaminase/5-amino-6-(5-phosphoribosylamino)uracil reductase RibD [Acidobacteriota bacterium]